MRTGFKPFQVAFALVAVGLLALSAASVAASTPYVNHGTQSAVAASTINAKVATRSVPAPDGVAGPSIQITGHNACGCAEDATGLNISYSNIPGGAVDHTLVIVNGVVYMDQEISVLTGSGSAGWGLFFANEGGTATGTWPLPSGQPITVIITIEDPLNHIVAGWKVVLDGCGNCNIVSSAQYLGTSIPTTSFLGLAVLAALLLIVGVFIILRLRA